MPPAPQKELTKKERKALEFKAAAKAVKSGADLATLKKQKTSEDQSKGRRHVPDGGDVPELDEPVQQPGEDAAQGSGKKGKKEKGDKEKKSKRKSKGDEAEEPADVPEMDEEPVAAATAKPLKKKALRAMAAAGIAVPTTEPSAAAASSSDKGSKKRKRAAADEPEATTTKTTFDEAGTAASSKQSAPKVATKAGEEAESDDEAAEEEDANKRWIVFVGNMSFDTTAEQLTAHFATRCGESPSVRLLTTRADATAAQSLSKSKQKSIAKGKAVDPGASRSKGCAFVEFKSAKALQKALQFHHTMLGERQINVELTAGGGGTKSSKRREKIKKKNEALEVERQKLHAKYVAPAAEAKAKASGEGQSSEAPAAKKAKVDGEGTAQWGAKGAGGHAAEAAPPAASSSGRGGRGGGRGGRGGARGGRGVPKWAATGANAVRMQG